MASNESPEPRKRRKTSAAETKKIIDATNTARKCVADCEKLNSSLELMALQTAQDHNAILDAISIQYAPLKVFKMAQVAEVDWVATINRFCATTGPVGSESAFTTIRNLVMLDIGTAIETLREALTKTHMEFKITIAGAALRELRQDPCEEEFKIDDAELSNGRALSRAKESAKILRRAVRDDVGSQVKGCRKALQKHIDALDVKYKIPSQSIRAWEALDGVDAKVTWIQTKIEKALAVTEPGPIIKETYESMWLEIRSAIAQEFQEALRLRHARLKHVIEEVVVLSNAMDAAKNK